MDWLDSLKEKFQVWFLTQRQKFLNKELSKLPSDNMDDYFFDNLTNTFIYKDTEYNTQIGLSNTLNVVKNKIENLQLSVENLEAIIDYIAQINVDTTNLQAIIANISTINANITNLQAIIANIASMTTNITNLQAIIADIANIESLLVGIDADTANLQAIITDINSLTAIIGNIASMTTNITNLQAIIADIANIETQIIGVNTTVASLNTTVGTIQTAIANIESFQTDIDINIASMNDLTTNIINQENKGFLSDGNTINNGSTLTGNFTTGAYLYNQLTVRIYTGGLTLQFFDVNIQIQDSDSAGTKILETNVMEGDIIVKKTFTFNPTHNIKYYFKNNSGFTIKLDYVFSFSELEQPYVIYLDSYLAPSTSKTSKVFRKFNGLINRMDILLYDSGTLNAQYTLESLSNLASNKLDVVDTTVNTGSNHHQKHYFAEGNAFRFEIFNNDAVNNLYYRVILFFSNSFYTLTELEYRNHSDLQNIGANDHISNLNQITTRNHSDLQNIGANDHISNLNQITTRNHSDLQNIGANDHISNLNQITTRNHSDLQNVSTSQHHVRYANSEAVAAVEAAGLTLATTKLYSSQAEFGIHSFGLASIGNASYNTFASFNYRGAGANQYAMLQSSGFATYVNGVGNLYLRISNANRLVISSVLTAYCNLDMNTSYKIVNLAEPTNPQDAATKNYVDTNTPTITLDNAFDNGKIIDGANNSANAVKIGDGTRFLSLYSDGTRVNLDGNAVFWIVAQTTIRNGNSLTVYDSTNVYLIQMLASTTYTTIYANVNQIRIQPLDTNDYVTIAVSSNIPRIGATGDENLYFYDNTASNWNIIHADAYTEHSAPLPLEASSLDSILSVNNLPDNSKLDYEALPEDLRYYNPNVEPNCQNGFVVSKAVLHLINCIKIFENRITELEKKLL